MRSVTTYASAAPELLRRVGHEPGVRDVVLPAGPIRPGATVRLRKAKSIQLVLDGTPQRVWVHGLTVGEALTELGMPPEAGDFVFPDTQTSLNRDMQVVLRNAIHVVVRVDGKTRDVVTSAPSVGRLLEEARVKLGSRDRVAPGSDTVPSPELQVRVVRVKDRVEEKQTRIPFAHREERDAKLEMGLRRFVQKGAEGIKVRRYVTTLEDGKPVARKLVSERLARKPRDELVKVGTGQPAYKGGGNSQDGLASWFRAEGLSAAHRTLPKGTVVKVTNVANGRSVNVVIRDRGPFVDGRVIDLSSTAFAQIAPIGSGTARVRLDW